MGTLDPKTITVPHLSGTGPSRPNLSTMTPLQGGSAQREPLDVSVGAWEQPRPFWNIILVVVDDVGLEIMGAVPNDSLFPAAHTAMGITHTNFGFPELQMLTRWRRTEGVACSDLWTAARCSPTRAKLMTGRYNFWNRQGTVAREDELAVASDPTSAELQLAYSGLPLPEMLRRAGYNTAMFGKHHLALHKGDPNGLDGSGPLTVGEIGDGLPGVLGFGHFEIMLANLSSRIGLGGFRLGAPPETGGVGPGYYNFNTFTNSETAVQVTGTHATEWTVRQATSWMTTQGLADRPFFCYLPLHACHSPFGDKDLNAEGASGLEPPTTYRTYANPDVDIWDSYRAGMEHIDIELELMEATLAATSAGDGRNLLQNTLILVIGDNGIPNNVGQRMLTAESAAMGSPYNSILNGGNVKGSIKTAGVLNWLLAKGPTELVGDLGRDMAIRLDAVDIYATLRELACGETDQRNLHGRSFLRQLAASANEADHGRDFHYSELFAPNGNPFTDLTDGGVTVQNPGFADAPHEWEQTLEAEVGGTRYKLDRYLDGTEELYDYDADPYQIAAPVTSGSTFDAMVAKMDALVVPES